MLSIFIFTSCNDSDTNNETAEAEQKHTEENQARLNVVQPAPDVTWSLERSSKPEVQ